ncbi:hypothetical protein HHI36_001759 [Cryptolaemus montrouzieri]|uniref:Uncharacterized protein n=1 Tax=Cryptolaemus montrouzieri TaxID=559131 RepID=A0ABD2P8J5_9CUCU
MDAVPEKKLEHTTFLVAATDLIYAKADAVCEVWPLCVTLANVISGSQATGIYPFNLECDFKISVCFVCSIKLTRSSSHHFENQYLETLDTDEDDEFDMALSTIEERIVCKRKYT